MPRPALHPARSGRSVYIYTPPSASSGVTQGSGPALPSRRTSFNCWAWAVEESRPPRLVPWEVVCKYEQGDTVLECSYCKRADGSRISMGETRHTEPEGMWTSPATLASMRAIMTVQTSTVVANQCTWRRVLWSPSLRCAVSPTFAATECDYCHSINLSKGPRDSVPSVLLKVTE
ncbi:hypothetical protein LX36DRAFT_230288 [Colletotrichum falcatum]|nr:hypothetical protein LX36DRAFT_230288 [Colletotrichum falcatum]